MFDFALKKKRKKKSTFGSMANDKYILANINKCHLTKGKQNKLTRKCIESTKRYREQT